MRASHFHAIENNIIREMFLKWNHINCEITYDFGGSKDWLG